MSYLYHATEHKPIGKGNYTISGGRQPNVGWNFLPSSRKNYAYYHYGDGRPDRYVSKLEYDAAMARDKIVKGVKDAGNAIRNIPGNIAKSTGLSARNKYLSAEKTDYEKKNLTGSMFEEGLKGGLRSFDSTALREVYDEYRNSAIGKLEYGAGSAIRKGMDFLSNLKNTIVSGVVNLPKNISSAIEKGKEVVDGVFGTAFSNRGKADRVARDNSQTEERGEANIDSQKSAARGNLGSNANIAKSIVNGDPTKWNYGLIAKLLGTTPEELSAMNPGAEYIKAELKKVYNIGDNKKNEVKHSAIRVPNAYVRR